MRSRRIWNQYWGHWRFSCILWPVTSHYCCRLMHSACRTQAAGAVCCNGARQDPIRRLGVWTVQMWRGIRGDSPAISLTCDARRLPPEASSSWSYSVTPNSITLNICYPCIPVVPGRCESNSVSTAASCLKEHCSVWGFRRCARLSFW